MEIISVKVGSPSQAPSVNVENPSQVKATLKDVNIQTGGTAKNAVLYDPQDLTDTQKEQARINIAAASQADLDAQAETKISEHNVDTGAHNDIRRLIDDLTNRLNTLANLETEVVDVPFRIEWDGSDYSSLEVVASYFYKVSDVVLTEEQLAQGGFFAYLYNGASIIQEFTSRVTNTGDYILIQGREGTVRIYLENNSVGASPGIYFYRTSYVQVFFLEATGCKVSEVVKLNEKHLPETDVIPGQYGGLHGSYYSIPNIKVDSTGRVIEASESVISEASSRATGLMSYAMYTHVNQGNHVTYKTAYFAINSEYSFALSDVKSTYTALAEGGYIYLPIVYTAYAYLYTDTSKTTKALVPAPYKVVPNGFSRCTVKLRCPEEYREFNLNDGDTTGEASYIECIVVYEKPFTTSSGH